MNPFINTITSQDPAIRDIPFPVLCKGLSQDQLSSFFLELEDFRKSTQNLYEKVRASIFLYAGYRFFLLDPKTIQSSAKIPVEGYKCLLERNFERALSIFHASADRHSKENLLSCLAESYHQNTFQILADQVRKSVRSSIGNRWMFRVGHPDEHPLKIHPELLKRSSSTHLYPLLCEQTPVRIDLTHSCWSDIFFLGMDYPEGARVINISADLGVFGRDKEIKPPIESYLRIIDEPIIRITSLDLNDSKDISELADLFNFGNDYLGLLKAALIASGFIPPSFEGTRFTIKDILDKILYHGLGIELVTKVNDIPKGSRLAVSTNLLASMITLLMRATQQTRQLEGTPTEQERDLIASRAILGEWLGGSGGGWQDSGGVWPGIKAIEGVLARTGDAEYTISRGCLLPHHTILKGQRIHSEFEKKIASSLILMHGGMASNVGPILEMVTEKYLLRASSEWNARQRANTIYDEIAASLRCGDIKKLASLTGRNFDDPIKTIIPWATTYFTELIIKKAKETFKYNYWGFLMLGGMSGGGMGMFVDPNIYEEAKHTLLHLLQETKQEMEESLPFAMDPVVYDFAVNNQGTIAHLLTDSAALMPKKYYALVVPQLARLNSEAIPDSRKIEIDLFSLNIAHHDEAFPIFRSIIGNVFQYSNMAEIAEKQQQDKEAERIKRENGFDPIQHEQIRNDLRKGRIGLNRNRLPLETSIEDVSPSDVIFSNTLNDKNQIGLKALKDRNIAMLCLAAGVGSRWTKG
ncbi:MAG: UTP--glucose-1-phosphate uridylyltransferase, partial [Bacteroidota bacterium]